MASAYDLIVRGARVLDPATNTDRIADIGVAAGRIAAIEPQLTSEGASAYPADGLIATPGLVDLHTHVFSGGSYWGIQPDPVGTASGVTTWVDAGSAGAYTIDTMRRICGDYRVNVRAFLHISGIGLAGCAGESVVAANLDVEAATTAVARHADFVCGIKVRMDSNSVGQNGLEPLAKAIEVGDRTGLPVMAHVGLAPPTATDVADMLRPGDILTHCWSPRADWRGRGDGDSTVAYFRRLAQRGIVLDIGHGASSFAFAIADQMTSAGIWPHTISTDLHANSVHGPVWDLPTTMAKLTGFGMPLMEVLRAVTQTPARVAGLVGGHGALTVGGVADLALFALEPGPFEIIDSQKEVRTVATRLRNVATFVRGIELT